MIIRIWEFSIDEIFEKELYLLIPYHIFVYENFFDTYESEDNRLEELKDIYIKIIERLDHCMSQEILNEYVKCTIINLSKQVLNKICANHHKVQKGVGSIMGGQILNYEAKDILNLGKREGKLEQLLNLIQIKLHKGKSLEQIADETEETVDVVQTLIEKHNLVK